MPTSLLPIPIVVFSEKGRLGRTEVRLALPPPSAAGLVHSTSRSSPLPWPKVSSKRPPVRPKIELAGGVWLKVENATTHPVWVAERQARTLRNEPPRSLPFFTVTLPPSR